MFRASIFLSFSALLLFTIISLLYLRRQIVEIKRDIVSPSGLPLSLLNDKDRSIVLLEQKLAKLYDTKKTWYNSTWVKKEIHRTVARLDRLKGYNYESESLD